MYMCTEAMCIYIYSEREREREREYNRQNMAWIYVYIYICIIMALDLLLVPTSLVGTFCKAGMQAEVPQAHCKRVPGSTREPFE